MNSLLEVLLVILFSSLGESNKPLVLKRLDEYDGLELDWVTLTTNGVVVITPALLGLVRCVVAAKSVTLLEVPLGFCVITFAVVCSSLNCGD